jgi:hypothetical protein
MTLPDPKWASFKFFKFNLTGFIVVSRGNHAFDASRPVYMTFGVATRLAYWVVQTTTLNLFKTTTKSTESLVL